MPWGRVDDTYYDHPKLEELVEVHAWPDRVVAAGLNALAWSWCNRFLTDGKVPRATVIRLMGPLVTADEAIALANQLVAVGLWEEAAGGYVIHDFLHYNDSREQVLARRSKEAARKAAYRSGKRPTGSPNGTSSVTDHLVPADVPLGQVQRDVKLSRAESQRVSRDSSRARIPTRPDPTRPSESLREENPGARSRRRADVQALHDRGWTKVTKPQRRILDEVLGRHDRTGPEFAASAIRATPPDKDPLDAVMAADRLWQESQRRKAAAEEQDWAKAKAEEQAEAAGRIDWLEQQAPR